jgi:hypothetical protein
MKLAVVFVASRVILDAGEPEEGQSREEYIQNFKECIIGDPFSFIDVSMEHIEVSCVVTELK